MESDGCFDSGSAGYSTIGYLLLWLFLHPLLTDQSLGYSNGYLGNVYSRCLAIACTLPHASKLGSIGTPKVVDGTTQGVALDRVSSLCIVRQHCNWLGRCAIALLAIACHIPIYTRLFAIALAMALCHRYSGGCLCFYRINLPPPSRRRRIKM